MLYSAYTSSIVLWEWELYQLSHMCTFEPRPPEVPVMVSVRIVAEVYVTVLVAVVAPFHTLLNAI